MIIGTYRQAVRQICSPLLLYPLAEGVNKQRLSTPLKDFQTRVGPGLRAAVQRGRRVRCLG